MPARRRARRLNTLLLSHFAERDIFRIDHFLGNETVEALLVVAER